MIQNKSFSQLPLFNNYLIIILLLTIINCASTKRIEIEESLQKEREVGRGVSEKLLSKFPILKNPEATIALNNFASIMTSYSSRSYIPYTVGILDSNEIFAYSIPGGYIFISKGVLLQSENEIQLAGVMAHEIAHVDLKHSFNPDSKSSEESIALSVMPGSAITTIMQELIDKLSDEILKRGRSKEVEFEADEYSVYLLKEMDLPISGLSDFLKKLNKPNSNLLKTNLETHPNLKLRIEKMERIYSKINQSQKSKKVENLSAIYKRIKEKL